MKEFVASGIIKPMFPSVISYFAHLCTCYLTFIVMCVRRSASEMNKLLAFAFEGCFVFLGKLEETKSARNGYLMFCIGIYRLAMLLESCLTDYSKSILYIFLPPDDQLDEGRFRLVILV